MTDFLPLFPLFHRRLQRSPDFLVRHAVDALITFSVPTCTVTPRLGSWTRWMLRPARDVPAIIWPKMVLIWSMMLRGAAGFGWGLIGRRVKARMAGSSVGGTGARGASGSGGRAGSSAGVTGSGMAGIQDFHGQFDGCSRRFPRAGVVQVRREWIRIRRKIRSAPGSLPELKASEVLPRSLGIGAGAWPRRCRVRNPSSSPPKSE